MIYILIGWNSENFVINKSSTIHSIDRQKSYIHFNGLKSLKTSYLYKKYPQGLDRQKTIHSISRWIKEEAMIESQDQCRIIEI